MPDNRRLSIPNSNLTVTPIFNFSREGTRRLDVNYPVSYGADMDQVFSVLRELAENNPAILRDPAPEVHLDAYADSSCAYLLRVWCKSENYWNVYYYLMEEGKRTLDKAGIEIPFPQMDVHLK
jgi:small conductance mechanosensitive channel